MRTFTIYLLLAISIGLLVAGIVIRAAWNLGGVPDVCGRQTTTMYYLKDIAFALNRHKEEHGSYPAKLPKSPELDYLKGNGKGPLLDSWGNPIQYSISEGEFALFSFGRDGKPGGVGLDADLYFDGRNRDKTRPTFEQFYFTDDEAEVANDGFVTTGIMTGILVAVTVLVSLQGQKATTLPLVIWQQFTAITAIVVLALVFGLYMLVVHIPNGH